MSDITSRLNWDRAVWVYVAEEKWDEAWLTYEQLVNLTGENSYRGCLRQASVNWADALLNRGEPEDVKRASEMFQESVQDYQEMGTDGCVELIGDRLTQIK